MKDIRSIIANNIKTLRAVKKWTQTDLSDASGVSFRGLQDIEGGKRSARPATLKAIAGALEVPEEKLYLENLGANQPKQDLSQIKVLLAEAAQELKVDGSNSKDSRLTALDYVRILRSLTKSNTPCVLFTGAIIKDLEYLSKLNCKVIEKPIMIPHLLDRLVEIYIEHLEGEIQAIPFKIAD